MKSLLVRWIVNALALLLVCYVVRGIRADSIVVLFVAAAVLGLLNAVVRPILVVLTAPLWIITFGLFLIVVNGAMLWLAGLLVPGFTVDGFVAALFGAILLSVISFFTGSIGKKKED
ncbi:MAG: phage holin family protein [Acidobacteria bacterium]|nr:phage holin family protein [Acidobacteriota bacterium]